MTKKKKSQLKSNCCNAKVIMRGVGDFNDKDRICTIHYECAECHIDCDVHFNERRGWNINPATKIVPNKKKKNDKLFTDKELKRLREGEDY